jgi:hypothetical protein
MWTTRDGFWGRGTQRQAEQRGRRERGALPREEETLRNDQRADQERRAKDSTSERNHNNTINTVISNTEKRAAVYSDANHLVPRSKKPRIETTKGEEAGVNPGGVEVVQKAYKDDEVADQVYSAGNLAARMSSSIVGACKSNVPSDEEHSLTGTDGGSLLRDNLMCDSSSKFPTQTSSLPAALLRSCVENDKFQAANERLKQGFDRSLSQPFSKGDAAADARIQKLEQELHILEDELKNENEKLYADAVHNSKREAKATATANGMYRARWTRMV